MTDASDMDCGSIAEALDDAAIVISQHESQQTATWGRNNSYGDRIHAAKEAIEKAASLLRAMECRSVELAARLEREIKLREEAAQYGEPGYQHGHDNGVVEGLRRALEMVQDTEQESVSGVDVWDVLRDLYTRGRLAGTTLDAIQEEYKARVRAMEEKSMDGSTNG